MNRMVQNFLLIACIFYSWFVSADENDELYSLIDQYNKVIIELEVPGLQLGYLENLNNIADEASRAAQSERFTFIKSSLISLGIENLDLENRYRFQHLDYRLELQLRRLSLENRYRTIVPGTVQSTDGIYHQPLGNEWYQYFLDNWLSISKSPEELFVFGESEVLKVQAQIREVQAQTGYENDEAGFYRYLNSEEFLLHNEQDITKRYQEKADVVESNLGTLFHKTEIPDITITPFPESNKDTPPGQMVILPEGPEFWFNFFQDQHNIQDMDFLVLHEVVPGHWFHFEYDSESAYDNHGQAVIWNYHGLSEGWGAYVEELGNELGLYQEPIDLMGKLKFDLVRSARVVLDVGINNFGWDNQQAMAYWQSHIKGQDAIARREIDRVRRWPGQAISYKVGADTVIRLKSRAQEVLAEDFDVREFHHQVLGFGGVPLFLVEQRINDYIDSV